MDKITNSIKNEKRRSILYLSIIIFLIFFITSFGVLYFTNQLSSQSREKEFKSETNRINEAIIDRLEIYVNTLYGARGFFNGSDNISREEWKTYVDNIAIEENYSGIQGIGLSVWILPNKLTEHIETIRSQGFPGYAIYPEGERSQYTSIIYLEPFDSRNQQAFGFDMYQEPVRREAMNRSIDSGEAAMTGKVTLVQETDQDVQSGFLIYVPAYNKGFSADTVEERRNNLYGFIYSPFRMNNFINSILERESTDLSIEIFDTDNADNFNNERKMYGNEIANPLFSINKQIIFAGHTWTVRYSVNNKYKDNPVRSVFPTILFIVFVILGIVTSYLLYLINTRKEAALLLAQNMTADLKKRTEENEFFRKELEKSNKELKKNSTELSKKILELENLNKYMVDRELKMVELKNKIKKKDI